MVVLGHIDHGKCIAPETLVPLANGEILSIEGIWKKYTQGLNIWYIKEGKKEGWIANPKGLKVFSFDGSKIVTRQVQWIWKLKAPSRLIKIVLTSGDEVIVTPEHPFFLLNSEGKIEEKKADLLRKEEFVIVPQKLHLFASSPMVKKRVAQRLRALNNFAIFVNREKGGKLFQKLQETNKQELHRKGLFSTNPYKTFRYRQFRSRDFIKLGQYFGFFPSKLYEMIDFLKNSSGRYRVASRSNKIKLPKIPKDLEKLGYIIGCLAGDGQTKSGIFHNSNPEIQNTFRSYIEEVFGVTTKLIKTKTSYKIESSGYKTLTRFLTDIAGFPRWKKSGRIKFPQLFSNLSFIRGFIAGWFDTDGYVSPINYSIEFSSKSRDLVKEISILLLYFGIHSTLYKAKKKGPGFKKKRTYYYLRVANDPYLARFLNCFPIKHEEKKKRVQAAIAKSSVSRIFDLTPISGQNLLSFYINNRLFPYFTQRRKYKFLSRYFLRKLLEWGNRVSLPKIFSEPGVKNLINPGEISCVKIRKIEYLENKYDFVYDLTIPHLHNFVAERVFIHNTTLLDYIQKTQVAEKEAGGITQHIGAYQIEKDGKKITFIDTPGHEAFSAMRSRGAKVADLAILVIDSCEGVKEQTKEAISHIKKAEIPFIVALNKIDRSEANPEKVKRELQKEEILVEDLGGKVPAVETSAKTGQGIDELLELILLVAEMENLKADISKPGEGVVIESYLDSQRGPTATLILSQGILKRGDIIGTPTALGKIKILENFQGLAIEKTLPSEPAIVIGFEAIPKVGENFKVFNSLEEARSYLRIAGKKEWPVVLKIKPEQKILNLILKTDVLGSAEAIEEVLKGLAQEKVILRILKSEVGEINESDIKLAKSHPPLGGYPGVILGFRVKTNPVAKQLAEREKIKIMNFEVIYDLVEGIRNFMEKIIEPEVVRKELGKVKILVIFLTEKNRQIVGGRVVEGEVKKGTQIEVFRGEELIGKGKLINLQKDRKDIEKAGRGEEVGILSEGDAKIEVGDVLVIYTEERKKVEL